MRKHILSRSNGDRFNDDAHVKELPIDALASVFVSSEETEHPIECAFDEARGPGGTRWVAGETGEQFIILAFDTPQAIRQVVIEIEERDAYRTQEIQLAVSKDGGITYQELRRQEFNFSPDSTTFEREEWTIAERDVTHVRLWIKPDKGDKVCRATLTSLSVRE